MTMERKKWTVENFSLANKAGTKQGNVPSLLRRVAKQLEAIGPVEVQDLFLHTEVTAEGPWHSLTVYFHRPRIARGSKSKISEAVSRRSQS